jgi:HD-GYP domain-containing protein (c-di-GMP phosphodiesterase class II)
VRHHHEFLDGTGYPDALRGEQISDIVRMITIVDVFSMLVEKRGDTPPMSNASAFAFMERMTGKIDTQLLQAFRPVAFGA